jgi:RNA polymerase sigma factor (sigma-70 family)
MMTLDSDEDLMAGIRAGDARAWQPLYDRWSGRLFDFLLRRTGSRAFAEEALQETWLRIHRYRRTFHPGRSFASWAFRIAANAGRDAREPDFESFALEGDYENRPDLRLSVLRALHDLEPADRRLFLLHVEGFDATEIGGMLDARPGTVRMQLSRVRLRLQAAIGGC